MSAESREDKFDRLWKRADEVFARVDKMFKSFPWTEPLDNNGFFHRTVTSPICFEEEVVPTNDPSEYKLVKTPASFESKEAIEEWLNGFGADGWDLNCFEFGYAIFSRFVDLLPEDEDDEDHEDETEESES